MALSYDLVSQFAKLVKDEKKTGTESTVYGTVVVDAHGDKYVRLDGSDQLTPLTDTSTNANDNERVSVLIKNHTATVTGNMSSPAARTGDVETLGDQVSEIQKFDIVLAEQIQANEGYIKQLQTDKANVGDLTAANAKITELETKKASIEQLNAAKAEITDLVADKIDAEVVNAKFATIESLNATNADIANLEADYGEFKDLTADNLEAVDATIKNLDSTYATIKSLEAEQARITDLEAYSLTANSAEINNLQADVADIDTLIFGSATGTTIQTSFANAVIAMLGNAQIKSAMIDSVAANKITAGDIITNNVRVLSEDGKLLISDETIQISDDTRVRVQIGKDASGDYSISIWDTDGKLMFSEGGITDNAIKDAIIRNDMVSDDANISASKLDISSLFTEINNSTQTINANKVLIDTDAGTLDVAFTKMETDISGLSSDVSSQGTALSVVQGQISSKVWQEDITTAIESVDADIAAAQEAAEAAQATANQNASDMANVITEFNKDVANLQTQIDGSIATWFYEVVPTNSNEPAKNWTTTELKNNHLGDLYYDTITGYCYRWQVQNNQYSWQRITDTDITKALADAAAAQDTADQKRRVFYSQPTVPYEQGDLWVQGAGGDILRCETPKTSSQSYSVSDWVRASKYTDDTAANNAQNSVNTLTTKHSSLEQTVNGISATVGQHTTQIANKADSSTVTTVSNKVTELETSLEGFRSTVSDTYATKTSLESVQSAAAQANTAAVNAQSKADQAAADAATAQQTADSANAKVAQAEADLATAQQNLTNVTSRVGATEEEIEAAQAAVTAAQTTANQAKADAATAQSTANTAKTNAANAQTAANNAKAAADAAQADVNTLTTRVTTAESKITQNSEQIALMATKTELATTLGGYYTKEETEAAISVKSDEINLTVQERFNGLQIGGRNLIRNSKNMIFDDYHFLYEDLDYIETTGTQYIDTEFIPNQDTRFVTELMMRTTSGNQSVYGSRQNANSDGGASRNFAFRVIGGNWQPCYGINLKSTGVPADTTKWHVIDQNKNVCRIYGIDSYEEENLKNGTTVVDGVATNIIDEQTFTAPHTLLIGAIRSGSTSPGTLYHTKARFRRSKLYDNGVLARDLVPRKTFGGAIGMYDALNDEFRGNAGTGEFVAGDPTGLSAVESAIVANPYSKDEECAKFTLSGARNFYVLQGVTTPGNKYALSFWIKSDSTGSITVCGKEIATSTEWQKIDLSYEADGEDLSFAFDTGAYYIYNPKLEIGDKVTDWTPAPEDFYTKEQTEAAIQVKTNEIGLSVSEVRTKVENINIGGRNLLANSEGEFYADYEFLQTGHDLYPIFEEHGLVEYTISMDIKSDDVSTKNTIQVYLQNGSGSYHNFSKVFTVTTEWDRYSYTFIPDANTEFTDLRSLLAFYGTYDTGNKPYVRKIKLEKGNKATDWTPAPEDMATAEDIDEANAAIERNSKAIGDISVTSEDVKLRVTKIDDWANNSIEDLNGEIATLKEDVALKVTSEDVTITIQKELENGTNKVTTTAGYTFDNEGMSIVKSGSETMTQITDDGMTVYQVPTNYANGKRNYYSSTTGYVLMPSIDTDGAQYDCAIQRPHDDCPNGFHLTGGRGGKGTVRFTNVVTDNGYWTVSFWIRGSQSTPVGINLDVCDSATPIGIVTTADNSWSRQEHTFLVTNYDPDVYNFVDFSNVGWAYYLIKDFKVEKGTTATEWTPAPEDVQVEMLTANSNGVNARNLHATTYLIVGLNSRFEDYGTNRTGCFWIGG